MEWQSVNKQQRWIISSSIKDQLPETSDIKPKPTYTPLEKPKTDIKNTLKKEDTILARMTVVQMMISIS